MQPMRRRPTQVIRPTQQTLEGGKPSRQTSQTPDRASHFDSHGRVAVPAKKGSKAETDKGGKATEEDRQACPSLEATAQASAQDVTAAQRCHIEARVWQLDQYPCFAQLKVRERLLGIPSVCRET